MDTRHTPVLCNEVLQYLEPIQDGWIVDCTLNGGGHTRAILAAKPQVSVLGIEWDPTIAREFTQANADIIDRVKVVNDSYANLQHICQKRGIVPGALLFDLGLSSIHYASSGRGFSFMKEDEPLDMRFNPSTVALTAGQLLNEYTQDELAQVLTEYGEEQFAQQIAAAVVLARRTAPFRTVADLVRVIEGAVPAWYRHRKLHCATKTFQALRVVVNDELGNVQRGLEAAINVVAPGGRILVISFQGAEDKIARELFKLEAKQGRIVWVTRSTIRPAWSEIEKNPRARSAKLKIIERCR
jgi:16S rRNA (cytosine1402-N4)-methyltransferase